MEETLITEENTFLSKQKACSLIEYKSCLEKYGENFTKEISLETKSKIFLDANVLLRYYSISFTARHRLFEFIEKHSTRIIISHQVQIEFLRNREDVIQRFFEQVTNKIPRDFAADIINKSKNFLEQHKVVLKDYPFVESGLARSQKDLESLLEKLNQTVDKKRKEHLDLIVTDEFLNLLAKCTLLPSLTSEELLLIKSEFDGLKKNIPTEGVDSLLKRPNSIFPGLGDIKEKIDDPYGDYIIYHELLKYMISKKESLIFLTFDNTKGDWMTKRKSPYLHYVLNSYQNTGNLLFIVDAERTLGNLLDINIDSLISEQLQLQESDINVESLQNLIDRTDFLKGRKQGVFQQYIIDEFKINGYSTIQEIERDLNKAAIAVQKYSEENNPSFNTIGILRNAIRIANPLVTKTIGADNKVKTLTNLAVYEKYRNLYL